MHVFSSNFAVDCVKKSLKGDSLSADFCLVTDKIMPDNPYIHPMWTGSKNKGQRLK